jgi:bifunctional enzyme CysN/CysC
VNRPNLDFRGFCGTVASGIVRRGDEIMVLPSRKRSRVKSIVTYDGDLEEAFTPQSVTLTLEDEIDVSRGDMIVRPGNVPKAEQRFDATMVWMNEQSLEPGKPYLFKQGGKQVQGAISEVRYLIDVNSLHRQDAATLKLNEIGRVTVQLTQPVAFDGYRRNRATGSFIVIDRLTNLTVAAGMILDRAAEPEHRDHWDDEPQIATLEKQSSKVTDNERARRFGQKPVTILLTGLSGSGKSTIAYALERRLFETGRAATVLDGQNLRLGISKDLGFSFEDRSENLRRGAEVARIINQAGLICVCAFAAPSEEVRQRAAEVIGRERFFVVHAAAPLDLCRARDQHGLYAKAAAGEIANFVGVSAPYEPPAHPDLVLPTDQLPVEESVDKIMSLLEQRGVFA